MYPEDICPGTQRVQQYYYISRRFLSWNLENTIVLLCFQYISVLEPREYNSIIMYPGDICPGTQTIQQYYVFSRYLTWNLEDTIHSIIMFSVDICSGIQIIQQYYYVSRRFLSLNLENTIQYYYVFSRYLTWNLEDTIVLLCFQQISVLEPREYNSIMYPGDFCP